MADKDTIVKFSTFLTLKRYSPNTVKSYTAHLAKFQEFLAQTPIERLNAPMVISKILEFIRQRNYGASSQKQVLGALRIFYNEFLGIKVSLNAIYPARTKKVLPQILSKKEVERMIRATHNLKHRTILITVYALGLRRSEVINLKITDIDGDRMLVHIKNAKGQKDRVLPLSKKLLVHWRAYYRSYRPQNHFFYGAHRKPYSESSLRKIIETSRSRAKIRKHITLHSLRHAYATHLLDEGTDIRIIQKLLGHSSIKTTMQYTHVTNTSLRHIKSPLDTLDLCF